MKLDIQGLGSQMFEAAWEELKGAAPDIRSYAEAEFRKIAAKIAEIEADRALSQISEDEARILLKMQARAARSVLLASEGLTKLAVEAAINAALDVARAIVNPKLGFTLI